MQAAIYIRWSTEDQGDGTTLDVQLEACQAYLAGQGWAFDPGRIFIDDGVSGATLGRPALTRLRAAVQQGQVDCVVVYKLDRLSRSVVDVVKLVLDEWDGRCCVKSAREPIDTQSQTGKLFFYQLMSFAEWERSVIRERTFAGKLRRAQEGRNPGIPAAYGFRLGPSGLPEIHGPEAQVVGLIFRLYLSGLGCTQIARRLDALGHPSPAGRRWSSGQVARMLANPVYAGTLVYGKQVTARGRKVRSDKPHMVRAGALPAIIDAETFAAVQKLRGARPAPGRSRASGRSLSSRSLLAGLLRCRCGHAYCGNGGTGARGRYRYYYCSGACGAGRIRQGELDELVTAALLDRLSDRSLLSRVGPAWEREQAEARTALAACEQELARLEGSAGRLRQWLLDGRITPEEYRELQEQLTARHSACEQRRAEAAAARPESAPAPLPAAGLHRWEMLEPGQRKQVLSQFVERVTAWRDRESGALELELSWRLPEGGGAP